MKNKIKIARKILNGKYDSDICIKNDVFLKLKDVTEKAELSFNDVKIKRIRSRKALDKMRKLELDLDMLLREVKN